MQAETEIKPLIEKEPLAKIFLKNSFWIFLASIIGRIGGIVFTVIIARLLQPELFGIYALATSVMLFLLTFADLGINATLLRYLASAIRKKDKKRSVSYFRYLSKIKILLTLSFALILLILAYPLSVYIFRNSGLFYPLLVCSFFLIISAFIGFYETVFYAVQKIKYIAIKEFLFQALKIGLAVIGVYLIANKVVGVITGIILASLAALIFLIVLIKRKYSFLFEEKFSIAKKEKKKINRFLFFLTISSITGVFFIYIDTFMLGIFVKPEFIGYYRAAYSIVAAAGALVGLISLANILLPLFTQLKGAKLERAFNKLFRYSSILTFPASFGLAWVAMPFISIIYGNNYILAAIPLYFLSFLIIESNLNGILTWFFAAKEKPEITTKILIIATLMNVLLNYVLITSLLKFGEIYAVSGAAIATLASRYFNLIVLMGLSKKHLKIKVETKSLAMPLIASLIMIIALIAFKGLINLPWPFSIFEILFAAAVYFTVLFVIKGIKKEDMSYILSNIPKITK